jgi:hypothetical protein
VYPLLTRRKGWQRGALQFLAVPRREDASYSSAAAADGCNPRPGPPFRPSEKRLDVIITYAYAFTVIGNLKATTVRVNVMLLKRTRILHMLTCTPTCTAPRIILKVTRALRRSHHPHELVDINNMYSSYFMYKYANVSL